MIKFLHAADIHLDSPMQGLVHYQGQAVNALKTATRQAFDALIELAIEQQVNFVLLAGDLFDGDWRDYNSGLYFVGAMNRLNKAGIGVYSVSGNHDAASQMSRSLRLPENVHVFSTKQPERVVLDDLGIEICGQGYANAATTEDLSQFYPVASRDYFSIAVLHTSLDGRPGHEPYAPCSVDGLISRGYDYWALGHVHQQEIVNKDPWIVYPGNLQGRHAREVGAKGCYLVTIEERNLSQLEFVSLDRVRWLMVDVDLSGCMDTDLAFSLLTENISEISQLNQQRLIALRLVIVGETALHQTLHRHRQHWEQECRSLANALGNVWLEKIVIKTLALEHLSGNETAALKEWFAQIEATDTEQLRQADVLQELSAFVQKLPAELKTAAEPFDPLEHQLDTLLDESKALLEGRLFQDDD